MNDATNGTGAAAPGIIRAWRLRLGVTQEELAHHVGVTVSTVNRWEQSHARPSHLAWDALEAHAAECGVPLEDAARARARGAR